MSSKRSQALDAVVGRVAWLLEKIEERREAGWAVSGPERECRGMIRAAEFVERYSRLVRLLRDEFPEAHATWVRLVREDAPIYPEKLLDALGDQ